MKVHFTSISRHQNQAVLQKHDEIKSSKHLYNQFNKHLKKSSKLSTQLIKNEVDKKFLTNDNVNPNYIVHSYISNFHIALFMGQSYVKKDSTGYIYIKLCKFGPHIFFGDRAGYRTLATIIFIKVSIFITFTPLKDISV